MRGKKYRTIHMNRTTLVRRAGVTSMPAVTPAGLVGSQILMPV